MAERDVKELTFKIMCKLRISAPPEETPTDRVSLLAVSNKYGYVFAGCPQGFRVLRSADIVQVDKGNEDVNKILDDFPFWLTVNTPAAPTHVCLSADDLILAVCIKERELFHVYMYDVRSFADKGSKPGPFQKVQLTSSAGDFVLEFAWNPGVEYASTFACVSSNGSVTLVSVADSNASVASLPGNTNATCCCWSPKGKQLVVGKADGSLTQYDLKLQMKKQLPCPSDLQNRQYRVLDVLWQSTYVFVATYRAVDADNGDQPTLIITNAPKNAPNPIFANYDDVCFGSGEMRQHKYYFYQIADWEMILSASSNALDTGILGKHLQDKNLWERWNLEDTSRAELPLTDDYQDTFPVGIAVDFTSTEPIPLGDNHIHPQSPIFMILTTHGVLCPFYIINLHGNIPVLNKPAQILNTAGQRKAMAAQPSSPDPPAQTTPELPQSVAPKLNPVLAGLLNTPQQSANATFNFTTPGMMNLTRPLSQSTPAVPSAHPVKPAAQGIFQVSQPSQVIPRPAAPNPVTGFTFAQLSTPAAKPQEGAGIFTTKPAPEGGQIMIKPQSVPASIQAVPAAGFTEFGMTSKDPRTASANQVPAPNQTVTASTPSKPTIPSGLGPAQVPAPQKVPPGTQTVTEKPSKPSVPATGQASVITPASVPQPRQPAQAEKRVAVSHAGSPNDASTQQLTQVRTAARVESRGKRSSSEAQTSSSKSSADQNDVFTKSILDEMAHFQRELQELRTRAASCKVDVGAKKEIQQLRQDTEDMVGFSSEIKESVKSVSDDITELKSTCIEAFAALEECKSRQQLNQEPRYHKLLQSRALDPYTAKKMKEIRTRYHHVENTMDDVDMMLDSQWEKSQKKKKSSRKLQTPVTDALYRTMSNNHNIIINQSRALDQITAQLQGMKLYNTTSPWQNLSNPKVEESVSRDSPQRLENILNRSLSPRKNVSSPISPQKTAHLREILGKRRVTPVKATSPANLSMSNIVPAEALRRSLLEDKSIVEEEDEPVQNNIKEEPTPAAGMLRSDSSPPKPETSVRTPPVVAAVPKAAPAVKSPVKSTPSVPDVKTAVTASKPVQQQAAGNFKTPPVSSVPQIVPKAGSVKAQPVINETIKVSEASAPAPPPPPPLVIPALLGKSQTSSRGKTFEANILEMKPPSATTDILAPQPEKPAQAAVSQPASFIPKSVTGDSGFKVDFASLSVPKPTPAPVSTPVCQSAFVAAGSGITIGQSKTFQTGSLFGQIKPPADSAGFNLFSQGKSDSGEAGKIGIGSPSVSKSSVIKQTDGVLNLSTASAAVSSGEKENKSVVESTIKQKATPKSFFPPLNASSPSAFTFGTPTGESNVKSFFGAVTASSDKPTDSVAKTLFNSPVASNPAKNSDSAKPNAGFNFSSFAAAGSGFKFGQKPAADTTPATVTSTNKALFGELVTSASSETQPVTTLPSNTQESEITVTSESLAKATSASVSSASSKPVSSAASGENSVTKPAAESGFSFSASKSSAGAAVTGFSFKPAISSADVTSGSSSEQSKITTSTATTTSTSAFQFKTPLTSDTAGQDPQVTSGTGGQETQSPSVIASATVTTSSQVSPALSGFSFTPPVGSATPAAAAGEDIGTAASQTTSPAVPGFSFTPVSTASSAVSGVGTTSSSVTFNFSSSTSKSGSILGGQSATPVTTTASGVTFGGQPSTAVTAASEGGIFGGQSSVTSTTAPAAGENGSSASVTSAPSTTPSVGGLFGGVQKTTSSSGDGLFGSQTSAGGGLFGSLSAETTTSSSQSAPFAGSATTTSAAAGTAFGFGASTGSAGFGSQPASSSGFSFGQPTSTSVFGKQTFGQTPTSSAFGSVSNTATSTSGDTLFGGGGTGGLFGGLGGKPSAENANKNVFGSSGFGSQAQNQSTSLFGSSSGTSVFGGSSSQNTGGFGSGVAGSGSFSSSGNSVASAGFGNFQQTPQSPGGFGSAPAFGGSPNFGGGAFGSGATFSNPVGGGTFGSPSTVFGSKAAGDSAGFAAFSSGNTSPTFGGIAQQSASPTFGALAHQGGTGGGATFGGIANQGASSGGFGGFGANNSNSGFGSPSFGGSGFGGSGFGAPSTGQNNSFMNYR